MTTIVIMPGGFHPFHAGHYALYQSAQRAFPDADVYVAATNDTSARPFPFPVKEKLAKLAGVEAGHFVQVKSPFRAEEITAKFDPARDTLIFVRSEKDSTKPPQPGGVKKDGSASYLQPLLGAKKLEPFAKHAYMAYLPTVEFGPGMTSATEIRTAWPQLNEKRKTALVMSLYPRTQGNAKLAATVVGLLDAAMGTELNEFAPSGNSASSYYAVTANFVNDFAQQKQEELQDLIDAGWTKQDLAQAGTLQSQAADIVHFEQVRDGFLKGLKPGFDAYLQGDTQMKDQLGEYWIDNDLPLNQDWEKIYGEPWGRDEYDEGVAEGSGFDQEAGIGIDGKSFKFKIRDLVALADNYPVTKIDPQQFSKQIAGRDEDSTQSMARAEKADLQYPIIVVKRQNGQLWIADGTHRAHKAIMHKLPSINAKIIPIKDMAPFDVDQGVAENNDYLDE